MRDYRFQVTEETRQFSDLVIKNLIRFGRVSESRALELIHLAWAEYAEFSDSDYRLHESPYYHAMSILHHHEIGDGDVNWWKKKEFWPPPKDVLDEW